MSVVVWEWWSSEVEDWLPHNAGVSRTLERAHHKNLTRVVLADADPTLHSHHVNLLTLQQTYDSPEGVTVQCGVRRRLYEGSSPAGRGICWEWAPDGDYQPLPMEFQCVLEQAWCRGLESASAGGWWGSPRVWRAGGRGGARGRGALRRGAAPPHPRPATNSRRVSEQRPRIPQQHTGSSVHSVQSTQSAQSAQSARSAASTLSATSVQSTQTISRNGARSESPRDRKPGLARQILHNLNIFGHNNKLPPPPERREWERDKQQRETERERERDSDTANRRHSVDTVSTYLSHESKDSLQASVGELVNTSAGSDDVFITESAPEECDSESPQPLLPPLRVVAVWAPQWGALCPHCVLPLSAAPPPPAAAPTAPSLDQPVALPCHHLLHLHCLHDHLDRLADAEEALVVECLVCGQRFELESPPPAPGAPSPGHRPAPPAAPAAPRRPRAQPPGSMSWSLHPAALPQHPGTSTIVVTYNFQSGRQTSNHPCPGEPYYAVGFPKYTVLPDTPLGRQVLSALRVAWSLGALFSVSASRRTGREHVVWWSTCPPPRQARDYQPLPRAHAQRALSAALARLTALTALSTAPTAPTAPTAH